MAHELVEKTIRANKLKVKSQRKELADGMGELAHVIHSYAKRRKEGYSGDIKKYAGRYLEKLGDRRNR